MNTPPTPPKVVTTDRIPLEAIDPDALKVIRRLRRYGHEAYLVGGCVRDLLLGVPPKDFDVITSARPRQVRRLFSNSRVIGRRFRLVHVIFGDNVVEVSTFRADPAQFMASAEAAATDPGERSREDLDDEAEAGEAERPGEDEGPGADDADDDDADAHEEDDDIDEGEGEPDAQPVTLSELGELVDTVHDPLDPDDPGPRAELEPDVDEPLAQGEDADEPSSRDDADDADETDDVDKDDDDDQDGGRRRGRPFDDDIDANNLFGDPEQDARRRDFTINALFYDPERGEIIDYTGGLEDIERRLVNPINDPDEAFVEDPVRMIRAARFAAKLKLRIEDRALAAISRHRGLLAECSQRRLLEEVLKILKGGYAARCLEVLVETGLIEQFLPDVARWLAEGPPPAPAAASSPAAEAPQAPDASTTSDTAPASGAAAPADAPPASGVSDAPAAAAPAAVDAAAASDEVAALAGGPPPSTEELDPAAQIVASLAPAPAEAPAGEPAPDASADSPPAEPAEPAEPAAPPEAAPTAAAPAPAEPEPAPAAEGQAEAEAGEAPTEDPRAAWGPPIPLGATGVMLFPHDDWEPDQRMVDAYLRVTWERPPLEGANDWVEDPHIYLADGIFEAAAFARDVVLEQTGLVDRAALAAERARAAAILKILRWNGLLDQVVASFPDDEGDERRSARRRRRRRGGRAEQGERVERAASARATSASAPGAEAPAVVDVTGLERLPLLLRYLEGLDRLIARGVPLTPAVQLAVLFAPLLLTRLEEALRQRGGAKQPSSEELADSLLFPIARRHSLARRDRDRIKRIVLSLRRMLTGELRRRARHGGRVNKLVARDYFREAIVLLWLHCRATGAGWEEFRYWEGKAKVRAGRS